MMVADLEMDAALIEQIRRHAEETYPAECCGFLLGEVNEARRRVCEIVPTRNRAAELGDDDRYRIDPSDYLRVDRRAREMRLNILGCYHSHPDAAAEPSAIDLATAWEWYVYLIVSVESGRATELRGWTLAADPDARRFAPVALAQPY